MSSPSTSFEPRCVHVGAWRITALCDGFFRLDGGAMWGVVPATMWRTMTPPAEDNTIRLALRPYLCERGDQKIVIEVGIGDRWGERERGWYHIEREPTLASSLAACGVAPEEITHVIASHCHWDHIGAQVIETPEGLRPLFPNAKHFAPAVEVESARREKDARRGSYRWEDLETVIEAGLLETFEGETELLPGITAHVLGGHSDGVSVITVEDGGQTAIFWADVVPTTHHVQPPYIMAYDVDVKRSFEQRSIWLERAWEGGWIGLFYHDADHSFARLEKVGKRYFATPIEGSESDMRILSLCPSLTELVFDLDAGDELVGRTEYCIHPADRVGAVEAVGGTKMPAVERIVELAPDIVLLNQEENRREDAEALAAAGLNCLTTFPRDLPETAEMVRVIADAIERHEAGERIARDIEARAARVGSAAEGREPVSFAYLIWRKPWMTVNADTFTDALLRQAGGRNVFGAHAERFPAISLEELAAAAPRLVLLSSEPFPFERKHVLELAAATGLAEERFRLVDGELLSWHGSRTPAGIDYAERVLTGLAGAGTAAD